MRRQRKMPMLVSLFLAVAALCSVCGGALASQLSPTQAPAAEHPSLSVEFNVVRDSRGKKTGFVELALVAQTPENEAFSAFSAALEYNGDVLQPVSWTLTPDASGKLTAAQLSEDANALGLNGTKDYCGNLPVKGDDSTNGGTANGGGAGYTQTLPDGTPGPIFNSLYFSAESRYAAGVAYPQATTLAVIRFYDKSEKFDTTGPKETPVVTYDGNAVTSANVTDFLRFADDSRVSSSPAEQSVWYASPDNQFYYVASYNGDPANLVDVSFDGATLKAPVTAGRRVLAVDESKTPADADYYSYMSNLLADVSLKVTSKLSYDSGGGTDIDNLATILFYDWDDTLLGTLTVEKGDARAEVNAYVEENFIHPDLRASTHSGADYTDSTARLYTYRDETYPADGPGGSIKTPAAGATAGDEYELTNKLDYSFYKRVTTKTVEENYTDPADPTMEPVKATIWKTYPVSEASAAAESDPAIPVNAEKYPYVNGWAKISDIKKLDEVWTTFGANGELRELDPESGEFASYGDADYFELVDFSDLEPGVYYVKACYVEGPYLLDMLQYSITDGPLLTRYGTTDSAGNATYSIQYQYERAYKDTDGFHGVTRTREPAVQVQIYPDIMRAGIDNSGTAPFFTTTTVDNLDLMNVDITISGDVWKINYVLTDIYKKNIATGDARSNIGNEMSLNDNFLYGEIDNNYDERQGTDGLVYQATLRTILTEGTLAAKNEENAFSANVNLGTLADLNLRADSAGAEFNTFTLDRASTAIMDAIQKAFDFGCIKDGIVDLEWHQLQYHIINFDSGGIFVEGLPLPPERCGGYLWCRLDDCVGGALPITNLPELLVAAYQMYSGANPNALGALSITIADQEYLRAADTGEHYTALPTFKAALLKAVEKLTTAPGTYDGATVGNADWSEVQYALINNAFKSKEDIALDHTIDYWWRNGNKPNITTLKDMLSIGYRVYVDHYDSSMIDMLDMVTINDLYLRANAYGAKFTNLNVYKAAFAAAIQTIAAEGPYTADTIGDVDWIVLQHLLIPGNTYKDALTLRNDPNINYWWEAGGAPKIETVGDLMKLAYTVYISGGDAAMLDIATPVLMETLHLRSTLDGDTFKTASAVKAAIQMAVVAMTTPDSSGTAPYDETSITNAPWKEVQYALIYGGYLNEVEITDDFWWSSGGYPEIATQGDMLNYAYKVYVEGKSANLLTNMELTMVQGLYLAQNTSGGGFTNLEVFKAALEKAVKVLTTVPAPYDGATVKNATWKELQYAILNDAYQQNDSITDDYWWEGGNHKNITTLPDLLIAAYQVYGNNSLPGALDGLNDLDAINNAPFWFRKDTEGTPFVSIDEFKGALRVTVAALKPAGVTESNIKSTTWLEAQHVILGNSYDTNENLLNNKLINYWWVDGNSKPEGIDADVAAIELVLEASKAYFGEDNDFEGVVAKYSDSIKLKDESGNICSQNELVSLIQEAANGVYDVLGWDPTFMDGEGYYAEMTWNELQYYFINHDYAEEGTFDSSIYTWRPGGAKSISLELLGDTVGSQPENIDAPECPPDTVPDEEQGNTEKQEEPGEPADGPEEDQTSADQDGADIPGDASEGPSEEQADPDHVQALPDEPGATAETTEEIDPDRLESPTAPIDHQDTCLDDKVEKASGPIPVEACGSNDTPTNSGGEDAEPQSASDASGTTPPCMQAA